MGLGHEGTRGCVCCVLLFCNGGAPSCRGHARFQSCTARAPRGRAGQVLSALGHFLLRRWWCSSGGSGSSVSISLVLGPCCMRLKLNFDHTLDACSCTTPKIKKIKILQK